MGTSNTGNLVFQPRAAIWSRDGSWGRRTGLNARLTQMRMSIFVKGTILSIAISEAISSRDTPSIPYLSRGLQTHITLPLDRRLLQLRPVFLALSVTFRRKLRHFDTSRRHRITIFGILLDFGRLGSRLPTAVHQDKIMASLDCIRWSDLGETLVYSPSCVTMTTGFTDQYPHGAGLGESEGGEPLIRLRCY